MHIRFIYNKNEVRYKMKKYLSFDIGGTSMKYGVLNEEGDILETGSKKTPKSLEEMYQIIVNVFGAYNDLEGLGFKYARCG